MKEGEPKENFIETLKNEVISDLSESIEAEFKRSANPWLVCFKGHLDPLQTYLSLAKRKEQISEHEYERLDSKIEDLKLKVIELIKKYPNKEDIPPDEIKKELLEEYNIFK
jgi:hypothetical protein